MARRSELRYKYGVLGAGALNRTLIGRFPFKREIGPVCGVSFRVASRMVNVLGAGFAVRGPELLNSAQTILFYAPEEQIQRLMSGLEVADVDWRGKSLVICDCFIERSVRSRLADRGASVALAQQFVLPGNMVVEAEGNRAALRVVRGIARPLRMKPLEVAPGCGDLFQAAVLLGTAAITPLVDQTVALFRAGGLKDTDAARIAPALVEQTARDYAHSGKQSWIWHVRSPDLLRLRSALLSAGPEARAMLRLLLLTGFARFGKHAHIVRELARVD
jgi:hypothetical protein